MDADGLTFDDIKRFALWSLAGLLLAAALAYAGDWAAWRNKIARGAGMGSVTVSHLVVAPLKGGKEEYFPEGTMDVVCSQSIFPQGGSNACWYVARNPIVFDR